MYHGMKRCRFCDIWEQGLDNNGYLISPCKDALVRPDPDAVCEYFRSGGLLPELAVDAEKTKEIEWTDIDPLNYLYESTPFGVFGQEVSAGDLEELEKTK